MGALAAPNLAGNILQFVDFSQKLVSRTLEFYNSVCGSIAVHVELETLSNDLSKLCSHLVASQSRHSGFKAWKEESELLPLAPSCGEPAYEFSEFLNKLKRHSSSSKFASLRQTLESIWNNKTWKDYIGRLENYRSQV